MYSFKCRGDTAIGSDSQFLIEVEDGSVLAITQPFGSVEFVIGDCRMAVADRWGVYCHRLFRRTTDPAITRAWARLEARPGVYLFRGVRFHVVAEEEWMNRFE